MADADLVFTGGKVFTADAVRSTATAVAVSGDRIVAVGYDEILDLVGPATEVVDLEGGLLVPGFIDAHVHPVWGGLDMTRCDLSALTSQRQYLQRIGEYAAENPRDDWILGGGWSMSAFAGGTPTALALDAVLSDRPVFLSNRDGHGAWVNSRALELAGVTRDTSDPVDGRIERSADGTPSGTLHEGAMALVSRLLPFATDEAMVQALQVGQAYLHSFGITGWQDAIVGTAADSGDVGPAYRTVSERGQLTGRVVGALWWDRTRGVEQIPELVAQRASLSHGHFRATSIKIMQDGVAENFTAAMTEPYCDGHGHPTDNSGISFVEPALLNEAAIALDALGFQLHFHAIGDRAVRECLDAVQAANSTNGRRDARHHIAHLQVVHPDDIPRFRQLGVVANMQSYWAALEPQMVDLTLPFLGEKRSAWQYPFGDLLRSGATLAAGSDWSVSTPDPLAAMHVAVNRVIPVAHQEAEYGTFLPEQRLDLATSLAAYTAGSAFVNHADDTGRITVGALADLAVLNRDPFEHPVDEIAEARVVQTFVGGSRVFAS